MTSETVHYQDGGHTDRTAQLERVGDSATLVVGTRRALLDLGTRDPGGTLLKGYTTDIAVIAYALLGLFKQWGSSYGDRIGFEWDGRKIVALYQEHPPDVGKNYAHPGVTLLEATGTASAPPGPTGPVATTAQPGGAALAQDVVTPDGTLLVALGLIGGVCLLGAAVWVGRSAT